MKNLKSILLLVSCSLTILSYAQNDSYVYYKTKDNPTKSVEEFQFIDGEKVNTLALDLSVNPKLLEGVDGFTIYVKREGVSSEGYITLTTEEFKSVAKACSRIPGNLSTYPRLIDYSKNPENGNGHFLLELHNLPMGAAFIVSKKGMDYSVNKEVDEYTLSVYAKTYKVIRYDQEWVNSENRYRDIPVYDPNPRTVIAPIKINVKTTATIDAMEKSNNVRDVNEFNARFGGGN